MSLEGCHLGLEMQQRVRAPNLQTSPISVPDLVQLSVIIRGIVEYAKRRVVMRSTAKAKITLVNPCPVGRGQFAPPPLWFFLNSKKTAARSAAKFLVPFRESI